MKCIKSTFATGFHLIGALLNLVIFIHYFFFFSGEKGETCTLCDKVGPPGLPGPQGPPGPAGKKKLTTWELTVTAKT